jgi:hypothetical protein
MSNPAQMTGALQRQSAVNQIIVDVKDISKNCVGVNVASSNA